MTFTVEVGAIGRLNQVLGIVAEVPGVRSARAVKRARGVLFSAFFEGRPRYAVLLCYNTSFEQSLGA
jgi:hypothetical protein